MTWKVFDIECRSSNQEDICKTSTNLQEQNQKGQGIGCNRINTGSNKKRTENIWKEHLLEHEDEKHSTLLSARVVAFCI